MFKVFIGAEKNVSGLDVAMDHSIIVQILQPDASLDKDLPDGLLLQALSFGLISLNKVVQIFLALLHHYVDVRVIL